MFGRSKTQRFAEPGRGGASALGPGAYDLEQAERALMSKAHQKVPLSGAARFSDNHGQENLGPGAYNLDEKPAERRGKIGKKRQSLVQTASAPALRPPKAKPEFNVPAAAETESERLRRRLRQALAEKEVLQLDVQSARLQVGALKEDLRDFESCKAELAVAKKTVVGFSQDLFRTTAARCGAMRSQERQLAETANVAAANEQLRDLLDSHHRELDVARLEVLRKQLDARKLRDDMHDARLALLFDRERAIILDTPNLTTTMTAPDPNESNNDTVALAERHGEMAQLLDTLIPDFTMEPNYADEIALRAWQNELDAMGSDAEGIVGVLDTLDAQLCNLECARQEWDVQETERMAWQRDMEGLCEELRARTDNQATLERNLDASKLMLETMQEASSIRGDIIRKANAEIAKLHSQLQSLEAEHATLSESCAGAKDTEAALRQQQAELEATKETLAAELRDKTAQLETSSTQCSSLEQELKAVHEHSSHLTACYQEERESFSETRKALEEEVANLRNQAQVDANAAASERDALQMRLREAAETLEKAQSESAALLEQAESQDRRLTEAQAAQAATSKALQNVEASKMELLNQLQQRETEAAAERARAKLEVDEALANSAMEAKDLRAETERVQVLLKDSESAKEVAEARVLELQQRVAAKEDQVRLIQGQNTAMLQTLRGLEAEQKDQDKDRRKLTAEIERRDIELENRQRMWDSRLADLDREQACLVNKIRTMEEERDSLRRQATSAEEELQRLRGEMEKTSLTLQGVREEATQQSDKWSSERHTLQTELGDKAVHIKFLEGRVEEQRQALQSKPRDDDRVAKLKVMLNNVQVELDKAHAKESQLEAQVLAFRKQLVENNIFLATHDDSKDSELAVSRVAQDRAKAELERLAQENARLSGHQNPKQKIQHLKKVKLENAELKMENAKLETLLKRRDKQLSHAREQLQASINSM